MSDCGIEVNIWSRDIQIVSISKLKWLLEALETIKK
jgi:hypothetical protein